MSDPNDFLFVSDDFLGGMNFHRQETNSKAAPLPNIRLPRANAAISTTLPADNVFRAPSQPYNDYRQQTPFVPGAVANTMALTGSHWAASFSPLSATRDDESPFSYNGESSNLMSMPMFNFGPNTLLNGSPTGSFLDSPTQTIQATPSPSFVDLPTFPSAQPQRVYPGFHRQQQQQMQQQQQQLHQQLLLQQSMHQTMQQSMSPQDRDMSPTPEGDEGANANQGSRETTPTNGTRRTKKALSEMDEDERLLNSEAAKSMPPRAKRQLRNKVSARNFRTRRKEYIAGIEKENRAQKKEIRRLSNLVNMFLAHPDGQRILQSPLPLPPSQPMEPFQMPQLLLQQQHLQANGLYPLPSTEDIDHDVMNSLVNFDEEDEFDDEVDEDTKPKKK